MKWPIAGKLGRELVALLLPLVAAHLAEKLRLGAQPAVPPLDVQPELPLDVPASRPSVS